MRYTFTVLQVKYKKNWEKNVNVGEVGFSLPDIESSVVSSFSVNGTVCDCHFQQITLKVVKTP